MAMESADIINAVLDADARITERLDEAVREKERIIAEARAEGELKIEKAVKETAEKIDSVNAEERRKADERIAVTAEKKAERLAGLEKVYSEKHKEWEKMLFDEVIKATAKI